MFDGLVGSASALFANPWAAAAGAACVAVPVAIHLINRLRYQRVRWAAMEFLLKAQKRVRRKLLIQQLLLLLLRCLMVLLVGILVARFFGLNVFRPESRATTHVVILDDSPSMADRYRRTDGADVSAYEEAQAVLTGPLAKAAGEATTKQRIEVYRLSDLTNPTVIERVNDQAVRQYADVAKAQVVSSVRVPLVDGLRVAQAALADQPPDVARVLHVMSDFRAVDWDEAGGVTEVVTKLTAAKVKVNLIDVTHPFRNPDDRRPPLAHDNLAITEFSPARLVAARYDPVEFTLRVRNFGAAEIKGVRFAVRVNGDENKGRSVGIDTLPGNQERTVKVEIALDRVGTDEKPLDRFDLVTASLESAEPGGLIADNVRHAVVEVRERLPVLAIDGRPALRDAKDGDGTYLRPVFTAVLGGYSWAYGTPRDLETADLSRYATVLLLNVPGLSDAAAKNLEAYAAAGGGVGFFLGPDVRAADYNKTLYRDGVGLFPVPLAAEPSRELTDEELQIRRFRIAQKKLLVRDPARRSHPALAGLYTDERGEPVADADQLERVFGFISIKRYWPVPKIGRWRDDPRLAELYCLPNDQGMADYEAATRQVADALVAEGADDKLRTALTSARDDLRRLAASAEPLYRLAARLDELLADQRSGDPTEAVLRDFWADPKHADLKRQLIQLRDAVKFGDPLYVAKEFGRGRVTVITTTAGETWTDWPSEKPGSASFSPVMKELAAYLTGAGAGINRLAGGPVEASFDAARVQPAGKVAFVTTDPRATPTPGRDLAPTLDRGDVTLTARGERLTLSYPKTVAAGAYLFAFDRTKPADTPAAPKPDAISGKEYLAAAVNIDAAREGDLRRATRDDILVTAPGARLHSAGDPDWTRELRNKTSDLSESWYLVLVLGGLLLAEQYLATRLSFNLAA